MSSLSDSIQFLSVGFVGLGGMGKPMVTQLARKLPKDAFIYVRDVVKQAEDDLISQFPEKIAACASAREVAEKSVSNRI